MNVLTNATVTAAILRAVYATTLTGATSVSVHLATLTATALTSAYIMRRVLRVVHMKCATVVLTLCVSVTMASQEMLMGTVRILMSAMTITLVPTWRALYVTTPTEAMTVSVYQAIPSAMKIVNAH